MKLLILFLGLLLSLRSFASFTRCPEQVKTQANYLNAWQLLTELPPQFESGTCHVELHLCAFSAVGYASDDIVGDILITTKRGEQQYVKLVFPKEGTSTVQTKVQGDYNWLYYSYTDLNPSQLEGAKQKTSIDIVLHRHDTNIKRLVVSHYTSREHDDLLGIIPISFRSVCQSGDFDFK